MLVKKEKLLESIEKMESQCDKPVSVEEYAKAVRDLIDDMTPAYDTSMVIQLIQSLKHPYYEFPNDFDHQQVINFYLEKVERIISTGGVVKEFNAGYEERIETMMEYQKNCKEAFTRYQQTHTRNNNLFEPERDVRNG